MPLLFIATGLAVFRNSNPRAWDDFSDPAVPGPLTSVSVPVADALPSVCHFEIHPVSILLILLSLPPYTNKSSGRVGP